MTPSFRTRWIVAALIGSVALDAAVAAAARELPTGEPFAVESAVIVPFEEVTAVSIVGIRGNISISTREKRELQVISRTNGPDGVESPVGIWQDGSRLIVAPAPGDSGGALRLDVEVPKGVAIAVEAADSDLVILSQGGTVDLHGNKMRATVQAVGGSVVADLVAGTLTVVDSKDVTARLRGTSATISAITGNVTVRSVGGTIKVAAVDGSTEVESEHSKLTFEKLSGSLRVTAQKGEAIVAGIKAGAAFALVGTPLRLKEGMGDITVTSDAAVVFQAMEASMRLEMNGGSLHGKGNQGDLDLRGRNTEVNVESITGVLHIQGDGLTATIVDVRGELQVEATVSDVAIDRAGDVVLSVDSGSVTIHQAAGAVKAKVTGADVHILDAMGAVALEMDGGDGEVSWAAISGEKESTLRNAGGKLTVRFPARGGCRVDAKSDYGRIDSELETIVVADDFASARGPVNNGYHPYVHITASDDILLEYTPKTP